ncbi:hypothetical protein [Gloeobacter morelensis]|uniref:Lipoprotein n=1 Tax=Gloeobacter morelensis MG652769 TaxID=2781736 RepID=A0ABY3PGK5_9CYAN|nr:hypothetical protein [Gloeobacter morelensis]UFP92751.1 hypothetical protein ISF26_13005 [Gloeobacter morelensis MG652769]
MMRTFSAGLLLAGALLLSNIETAQAAECVALKPVGSTEAGTSVKKSISPAALGVSASNWNTDFAVPGTEKFESYRVTITADSDGQYDVVSYLKYPNDKAQNIYEKKGISLGQGKTLEFSGKPQSKTIVPYQVNVEFGGALSIGKSYTVSAFGCK